VLTFKFIVSLLAQGEAVPYSITIAKQSKAKAKFSKLEAEQKIQALFNINAQLVSASL
jgi:hypothetical protein